MQNGKNFAPTDVIALTVLKELAEFQDMESTMHVHAQVGF